MCHVKTALFVIWVGCFQLDLFLMVENNASYELSIYSDVHLVKTKRGTFIGKNR